jgi:hypothetical protein
MIEGAGEMRTLPPIRTCCGRSALLPGSSCSPVCQDAPYLYAVESIADCRPVEKNMQNLGCLGMGSSRTLWHRGSIIRRVILARRHANLVEYRLGHHAVLGQLVGYRYRQSISAREHGLARNGCTF